MEIALDYLNQRCRSFAPQIAIVLGSGLGHLSTQLETVARIPYADIPGFPKAGVAGHSSELLIGTLFGRRVLLFCGRFHVYQGLSAYDSVAPVRLAAAAGCHSILLTSAVGGISSQVLPGDFFLTTDHLNFTGVNPLAGISPPPFIALHNCYRHDFLPEMQTRAQDWGRTLHSGVLAYMTGPSYETPAEIIALARMGADVVGMSVVPEAIMARERGLNVAALSLVTNRAAGTEDAVLSHEDVLSCARMAADPFHDLAEVLIQNLEPE